MLAPMHLHAVNFLGRSNSKLVELDSLSAGAFLGGRVVWLSGATVGTLAPLSASLPATTLPLQLPSGSVMLVVVIGMCGPFSMARHVRSPCAQYGPT